MKTLKVLLQEVVSGIKAWVNSNFAQESNTVHKTGNETVNGNKTFTGNVIQNQAGGVNVYCATCDGAVKGDLTSSGMFSIVCKDGSSANMETSGLAAVYMGQDTSGSYVALRADTSYNNTRYNASVSLDIDPTTANNNAIFRPRRDNTIDLGSSSYQFKDTYTKGLYVDGNQVDPTLYPYRTVSTDYGGKLEYINLADEEHIALGFDGVRTAGFFKVRWTSSVPGAPTSSTSDGTLITFVGDSTANVSVNTRLTQILICNFHIPYLFIRLGVRTAGTSNWTWDDWATISTNRRDFIPLVDNSINLGSTTNRWKTLNGINPGDLSLPDYDSNAKLEFTSEFPTPDSSGNIRYTPTMNGWLYVYFDVSSATINSGSVLIATIKDANMTNANCAQMFWRSQPASDLLVFFPVVANKQFIIQINFTGYTLKKALLIPGMGYVA